MKNIIRNRWGVIDSRLVNAIRADVEEIMDYSGLDFEDVAEEIEANAEEEGRGIFDMWYDDGNNTDTTARTIGKILSEIGWHCGKDDRTVDEVLADACIIDY